MSSLARWRLLVAGTALALLFAPAVAQAGVDGPPSTIATGLDVPWEMAVTAEGRTLITERPGRIRVLEADGRLTAAPMLEAEQADPQTRKFLGLALHPGWETNRLAYLYVSYGPDGGMRSKILRLHEQDGGFEVQAVVFDDIASDGIHDGGRMAFGPDGFLYVTTGDIHDPTLPQDRQSLNGKILRFAATGDESRLAPAPGNPFLAEEGNAPFVYSFGHRHPQGLAWDRSGRMYESEHGPTGERYDPVLYPGGDARSSRDEVNLIEAGGNYGWPVISGTMTAPGMRTPIATSGDGPAWAPGGLAMGGDGHLYMPALRGTHLRELTVVDGQVTAQAVHLPAYGRLRAATASGGSLLVSTDGPAAEILRLPLNDLLPAEPVPEAPVGPDPATAPVRATGVG